MRVLIAYDPDLNEPLPLADLKRAGFPAQCHALIVSIADVLPPPAPADPGTPPAAVPARVQTAIDQAHQAAKGGQAQLQAEFPSWTIEIEAIADAPAWGIIRKADVWHPDLIVVGAHRQSALSRFVLGSVSLKVLHEAPGSVRVVKRGTIDTYQAPRVLIGVDGSPDSDTAVAAVAARSWPSSTAVHVVGVVDPKIDSGATPESRAAAARARVEQIARQLADRGLTLTIEIRDGDPKQALLAEAEAWKADCIFVGARGLSAVERILLGSVSATLAARATCSVEVVRPTLTYKHRPCARVRRGPARSECDTTMAVLNLPSPLAALLRPDFYAHRPDAVELVQTHISFVFLAGNEVYKVKKSVRFSFLDFSSLERRLHFCREEVRLNRRLAPAVYLGVVSICRDGDRYRLGQEDDGSAVEYAVRMRRLRADRILANLLAADAATDEMIDAIAERIAAFHAVALSDDTVAANGSPEGVWRVLSDNFSGARTFRDRTIPAADDDRIQRFCRGFLDRHANLFARRQAEGRIRECHGDLHAEHISLDGGVAVFDCVEFNPQFRNCDVAAEIAFLAMDLDDRGYPALAQRFVDAYVQRAVDRELRILLPFYACYRAYVRGKVDSLKSDEAEVEEADRRAAADSARRHFALAYRYTWSDTRALVVIFGLSGSGKSVVARALAQRIGFAYFNSDEIRKELAGLPAEARGNAELYTSERSAATYHTMLDRARGALAGGRGAIVDATFQLRAHRDGARVVAEATQAAAVFVECICPPSIVRERLARRAHDQHEPSDADWRVYEVQRAVYQPFASGEAGVHVLVDTTAPTLAVIARLEAAIDTPALASGAPA